MLMMNSIKDKVVDLGMTSSARRVIHKNTANNDLQNKLMRMMKARRGGNSEDPEASLLSPQ